MFPRIPLLKLVFAYTRPPPTPLKMPVELESKTVPELVAMVETVEPLDTSKETKEGEWGGLTEGVGFGGQTQSTCNPPANESPNTF